MGASTLKNQPLIDSELVMQNGEFDEVTFDIKPKGNQTMMMPQTQGM